MLPWRPRPKNSQKEILAEEHEETNESEAEPIIWSTEGIAKGRRAIKDEPVVLAFKEVKLDELVEFIALETGKVVMPVKLKSASSSRDTYNIVG